MIEFFISAGKLYKSRHDKGQISMTALYYAKQEMIV